jgi:serine/threonine-protein phosphatase Stp1
VLPGDRFLLCSDGLTKNADFATLERVLSAERIETVCDTLQQIALDGGGTDNISIIVVDIF